MLDKSKKHSSVFLDVSNILYQSRLVDLKNVNVCHKPFLVNYWISFCFYSMFLS